MLFLWCFFEIKNSLDLHDHLLEPSKAVKDMNNPSSIRVLHQHHELNKTNMTFVLYSTNNSTNVDELCKGRNSIFTVLVAAVSDIECLSSLVKKTILLLNDCL